MSDLLALRDFNGTEFIDRINGLFLHCTTLANRAEGLRKQVDDRITGIRRHAFLGLAEIGEAFLHVQEARPGEFWAWFAMHEDGLGFSERHASRCISAAEMVRKHGESNAFALSQAAARAAAGQPILAFTVRLMRPIEAMSREERDGLLVKLEPALQLRERLIVINASESTDEFANSGEDAPPFHEGSEMSQALSRGNLVRGA